MNRLQLVMFFFASIVVKNTKSFSLSSTRSTSIKNKIKAAQVASTLTRMYSTTNQQQDQQQQRQLYGGDYAGQSATFSPTTGKLIPVPEHYVPSSMVEWGQIPSCFEIIVSEDWRHDDDDDENSDEPSSSLASLLDRCTVQIMPEVGCGLDNLDTMKLNECIPVAFITNSCNTVLAAGDISVNCVYLSDKNRIECIFTTTDTNENENNKKRTRVGINLFPPPTTDTTTDTPTRKIKSPIDIIQERQTSTQSSKGTIAKGGGLDARTVTNLVGIQNCNKPFSTGQGIDLVDDDTIMIGSWNRYTFDDNNDKDKDDDDNASTVVNRNKEYWNGDSSNDDNITTLSLPGNVIIRYRESPFLLEISFVIINNNNNDDDDDDDDDDDTHSNPIQRIVMKCELNTAAHDDSDYFTTEYCWEEKIITE